MYSSRPMPQLFQSTHPTRGCDPSGNPQLDPLYISIHAPHEGVRPGTQVCRYRPRYFNPRTPRGGATPCILASTHTLTFQSTHPTRGCDRMSVPVITKLAISIHAPHEGVRRSTATVNLSPTLFQSTHPTRGCDRNML